MWRSVLVLCLLAVVAAAERHKRLTTFGKAPEKTSQATGKGKECRTDRECLSQTVCKDGEDGKKRCVCEDGSQPVDGHCLHTRGLGKACSATNECIQGAECKINPNTTHKYKVCMCEEDMIEEAGQCSGCGLLNIEMWLLTAFCSLLLAGIHH